MSNTEDYVTLYMNSPLSQRDPAAIISLMFLFFGRMMPIIALSPFFGSRVLPHPVKVTFAFSLFAIFFPQFTTLVHTPLAFNFHLMLLMMKEIVIGLLMGFMVSIPFTVAQTTGMIIDHQRGGASLMVNDPTIQNQSSPLGTLFNLILIYIFFMIDGPFQVIDAVSKSYDLLPPDVFLSPRFFSSDSKFWIDVMAILGKVMALAVQLGAPALIIMLMTDVFLGIANRLAPQVQITFLGMPLKSLLAIAIIFFGFQLFISQLVSESYTWINYLYDMAGYFPPDAKV